MTLKFIGSKVKRVFENKIPYTATRLGIYSQGGKAMSGAQVENLKVHELAADINDVNVFYRASPRHKLKIVKVDLLLFKVLNSSLFRT